MQLNVDDLAEAMKALDGKKGKRKKIVCVFSVGIVTACRTLYWSCLSSLWSPPMDAVFALINRILSTCDFASMQRAGKFGILVNSFLWTAPIGFRLVTTLWRLPADQRGIEPPPVVCPRRQERRPTNYSTGTPGILVNSYKNQDGSVPAMSKIWRLRYCRGTSKCLQSCWGLEKLVLVSWKCHALAYHGLYEIWQQVTSVSMISICFKVM